MTHPWPIVSPTLTDSMRLLRLPLALAALLSFGACKHPLAPGEKIIKSTLKCTQPGTSSNSIVCDVPIPASATKLRVTLLSHDCDASGDIISVVASSTVTITNDACYATVGQPVEVSGPFTSSTVKLQVTSETIKNPPELRIGGTQSPWKIYFEDGGDQDFNDAVLQVEAL